MTNPAVLDQDSYRIRTPAAVNTVALNANTGWEAALNTPASLPQNTPIRIRFLVQETSGNKLQNGTFDVQYNIGGAGWNDLTSAWFATSTQYVNGATTTQVIGSGTYDIGDSAGGINNALTTGPMDSSGNTEFEVEVCLQLPSSVVNTSDVVQFRLWNNDSGAPLNSYTNIPSITALDPPPATAMEQVAVGARPDDSATLNAAGITETSTPTLKGEQRVRLRFAVKNTGGSGSFTPRLEYNDGSGYTAVTDYNDEDPSLMSSIPPVATHNSSQFTDGAATTALLTVTGTFVAGEGDTNASVASKTLAQNEYTEIEWCLEIRRLFASGGFYDHNDTIQFRVTDAGTPLSAYGATCTVTLDLSGGIIGGCYPESSDRIGPFEIGTKLYQPGESDEISAQIVMNVSSDGGDTWTVVDQTNAPVQNDMESLACRVSGSLIYMLHQPGDVYFHIFDTSTDTWSTVDQAVATGLTTVDQMCSMVVRSDGTVIGFYNSNDDNKYKIRSSGGVWGAEQDLDAENVTWRGVYAIIGESQVTHIFYKDNTNGIIYHRTLSSSDVLSGRQSVATGLSTSNLDGWFFLPPTYYDNAGVEVVTLAYCLSDETLESRQLYDGTLQTAQTLTTEVIEVGRLSSRQPQADLIADGTTLYCFYVDAATRDMWYRTHEQGSSWSSATEFLDGVDIDFIRGWNNTSEISLYIEHRPPYHPTLHGFTGGGRFDSLALSSQITATVGTANETDLSQSIQPRKIRQVVTATETDLSQSIQPQRVYGVTQAQETESAQPIQPRKIRQVTQAIETDTALPISSSAPIPVGQAQEVDTARPLRPRKVAQVGQAATAETAQPLQPAKVGQVGIATETELSQSIAGAKVVQVGTATETELSQSVTGAKRSAVGQAQETDTALSISPPGATFIPVSPAQETDTAQPVVPRKIQQVGAANEAELSQTLQPRKVGQVGQAQEADTALPITTLGQIVVVVGTATEVELSQSIRVIKRQILAQTVTTEESLAIIPAHRLPAGRAIEGDTALAIAVMKVGVVGQAQETDAALPISWNPRYRMVRQAQETDVALSITGVFIVVSGLLSVTGIGMVAEVEADGTLAEVEADGTLAEVEATGSL